MTRTRTVFWGASGHAKAVANAIRFYPEIEIVGYLDDVNPERHGQLFEGKRILGGSEQLLLLKEQKITSFILGFGHCSRRIEIGRMLMEEGFHLPGVIHPQSIVASDAVIGDGTVILAGAIIDPECILGKYVIVNNGVIVSHECVIGEGVHLCPGVNIAGRTTIGRGCWIGIGSVIIDKVKIGDDVFIGAGSVVTRDIPSGYMAYGNPAKIIRKMNQSF